MVVLDRESTILLGVAKAFSIDNNITITKIL